MKNVILQLNTAICFTRVKPRENSGESEMDVPAFTDALSHGGISHG